MPRRANYETPCMDCGGLFPPHALSRRRLCSSCAYKRFSTTQAQLKARSGPVYERMVHYRRLAATNQKAANTRAETAEAEGVPNGTA